MNSRHKGAADLTEFLVKDEQSVKEIAKNLGMKVLIHHRDIDYAQFLQVIKKLKKLIVENAKAGKKTFVYF